MPGLLNARVCNARFNGGKQYFDDLQISSNNEALMIDMVNGGGKSFLIQCIGQTIIPNSRWQNDWDFKAVFEPKNKNTVIHCLTEWELEDGQDYKYIIAGFCASKPTVENDNEDATYSNFERFSYICGYDNRNDNDIFNLPLKQTIDGKDRFMSLSELKKYLHKIKGDGYYAEVITSSREYRSRLNSYGITEAEWEIIKGVNADEKYVATYLRQYPTAEKFILNFLIPRIEDCYASKTTDEYQDSEKLATSLLQIREQLKDLMYNKQKSGEYDTIITFVKQVSEELSNICNSYKKRDSLYIEIHQTINYLENELDNLKETLKLIQGNITNLVNERINHEIDVECFIIKENEDLLNDNNLKLQQAQNNENSILRTINEYKDTLLIKEMENVYHKVITEEAKIKEYDALKKNLELSNEELITRKDSIGASIKKHLQFKIEDANNEKLKVKEDIKELDSQLISYSSSIARHESNIKHLQDTNERLNKESQEKSSRISSKEFDLIANIIKTTDAKNKIETDIEEINIKIENSNAVITDSKNQVDLAAKEINNLKIQKAQVNEQYLTINSKLNQAQELYETCSPLFDIYDKNDFDDLASHLISIIDDKKRELNNNEYLVSQIEMELSNLKNHTITLNNDTLEVYDILKAKYPNAMLGQKFIESKSIKEKEFYISTNELLPYSIILQDSDYKKFLSNKEILDSYYGGAIPVINNNCLDNLALYPDGISFTSKSSKFYTDEDMIYQLRIKKESELQKLKTEVSDIKTKLSKIEIDFANVRKFVETYGNKSDLTKIASETRSLEVVLNNVIDKINDYTGLLKTYKASAIEEEKNLQTLKENRKTLIKQLQLMDDYFSITNDLKAISANIHENSQKINNIEEQIKQESLFIGQLKNEKVALQNTMNSMVEKCLKLDAQYNELAYITEFSSAKNITESEFADLSSEFKAINDSLKGVSSDISRYEDEISSCRNRQKDSLEEIERKGVSLERLSNVTIDFIKHPSSTFSTLKQQIDTEESQLEKTRKAINKLIKTIGEYEGELKNQKNNLLKNYNVVYKDMENLLLDKLQGFSIQDKIAQLETKISELSKQEDTLNNKKLSIEAKEKESSSILTNFRFIEGNVSIPEDITPLTSIREYSTVKKELNSATNKIQNQINGCKRKIDSGNKINTHIYGFTELLSDLSDIPQEAIALESLVFKLSSPNNDESWVSMLEMERSKIDDNIKSLEIQEDKFITLCIQKCESILRDIKKLQSLSVIELNGNKQEMIRVNLNKLPDDIAKERMKNYIEGVINSFDENDDDDISKKTKLSKALTTDNLFKQIIERIKNKSIELYKLEDIENMQINEWKSLDKAYGSKGQTNGMYISLLICIISYLRKLSSHSGDESRKVLILDNPFSGTTSEIIWVPILNLLKENNVQLWAVGFEIKTQLADMFPVRYYLDKEKSGDFEKTIVAKFHSQANLNSLDYDELVGKKIDYNQISLDID